jgi:hypothetical protein
LSVSRFRCLSHGSGPPILSVPLPITYGKGVLPILSGSPSLLVHQFYHRNGLSKPVGLIMNGSLRIQSACISIVVVVGFQTCQLHSHFWTLGMGTLPSHALYVRDSVTSCDPSPYVRPFNPFSHFVMLGAFLDPGLHGYFCFIAPCLPFPHMYPCFSFALSHSFASPNKWNIANLCIVS